jgi:uncharacterized membrane protein YkgB
LLDFSPFSPQKQAGTSILRNTDNKRFYPHQTFKVMRSILYIIAVILIVGWLIGTFAYSAGSLIHILLVLAVVSFLIGLIRRGTV